MAQSRMTIKYTTYGAVEKTALYKILNYFTRPRKDVIFRLDYDYENTLGWDETDLFIPKLSISKLEFCDGEDPKKDHYATFLCDNKEQDTLLKLLYTISQIGDPGHSYGILFDGNEVGWDGDGCDRINEVNFQEYWNKPDKSNLNYVTDVLLWNKIYRKISNMYLHDNITKEEHDKATDGKFINKLAKELGKKQYERFLAIKNKQIETKK